MHYFYAKNRRASGKIMVNKIFLISLPLIVNNKIKLKKLTRYPKYQVLLFFIRDSADRPPYTWYLSKASSLSPLKV